MAYENAGLRCLINAGSQSIWVLRTADAVGTSGADIILDSVSITAGQTVTINSAVIPHAA